MTETSIHHKSGAPSFAPLDYLLYALTAASWSVSWYALSLQPGVVANEVSLVYRFVLSAAIMLAWVVIARKPMRYPLRQHLVFMAMGVCIFSTNFLLFYYGSTYLFSGLLSVVFSLASLTNMLLATIVFRERPSLKMIGAAFIGFAGIALLFWPEISARGMGEGVLTGLALCIAGTLCFSTGSLISSRMQGAKTKVSLVAANTWGMIYGAAWCTILAILQGEPFNWDPRPEYAYSLVFLAVVSTVIAFASYLTLVGRIGSGRAGYATVIFPVFALLVSTALEGYNWTVFAVAGLALVAIGNVVVMRGR
ncbi:MAG: DMT family transporter [Pseudomonadota bacterium]